MKLPARFLPHTVTVTPYGGRSSTGDLYGPPFPLRCLAEGRRRMVRNQSGEEVLSTLTVYAEHGKAVTVPVGSKVAWAGGVSTVLVSIEHDDGGMGAPQHTEISCV